MKYEDYMPIGNAPISESEARQMNPLVLAFVGDSVHHLAVRTRLACNSDAKSGELHKLATSEVKATAQANMFGRIESMLSDDEMSIYKRARNSKVHTMAKHATCLEYKCASGFEALIGYLYLTGKHDRLVKIYQTALATDIVNNKTSDTANQEE